MATRGIIVRPDAVINAVMRIDELCAEVSALNANVSMSQSRGAGASAVQHLSSEVANLSKAVYELLEHDRQRLINGLVAFEGTDSALAQMILGLNGAPAGDEG